MRLFAMNHIHIKDMIIDRTDNRIAFVSGNLFGNRQQTADNKAAIAISMNNSDKLSE